MGYFSELERKRLIAEEFARKQQEAKEQRLRSLESAFEADIGAVRDFFSTESQAAGRMGERTAAREIPAYEETELHLVFDYTPSGQVQPHAVFATFDALGNVSVSIKRDVIIEYQLLHVEGQFEANDPALLPTVKMALEKMVDLANRS